MNVISAAEDVLDSHIERVQKAYPAYFDTYKDIANLIEYLKGFDNLYCVGRNGQHRYNNMDHSMATSFAAVKHILGQTDDKDAVWQVNTEKSYHESKN
jgi:protoporphyrinogen oxidase